MLLHHVSARRGLVDALARSREWYGPWVVAPNDGEGIGDNDAHHVKGATVEAYVSSFPGAEVTAGTVEFGTYPPQQSLIALLQEHLLANNPDAHKNELKEIKAKLLEYHHPKDWEWRCAFWTRSKQVIRQALEGLSR